MMDELFATALHALTVDVEGGPVIVDLRDGTSVALNDVAAAIWRGVVRGEPAADVSRELASRFAIDEQRASADVAAFLSTLAARGLVHDRVGPRGDERR